MDVVCILSKGRTMNKIKHKYIFLTLISIVFLGKAISQLPTEIEQNLYSNIQGYELARFLTTQTSVKTEFKIEKIQELQQPCSLNYSISEVKYIYPIDGYQVVGVLTDGKVCGEIIHSSTPNLDNRFLIAFKISEAKNGMPNIKYISGEMYLDNISSDFNLLEEFPETFNQYIEMKMWHLELSNITFMQRTSETLTFEGFSSR